MAPTPSNGSSPHGLEAARVSALEALALGKGSSQEEDRHPERSEGPLPSQTCHPERSGGPASRVQHDKALLDAGWSKLPPEYRIPEVAPSLEDARAYCERLATSHYENFSVATWFLPRRLRPHFHSVYAYCRISDDLGDEVGDPQQSLALLDLWQSELDATYASIETGSTPADRGVGGLRVVAQGGALSAAPVPVPGVVADLAASALAPHVLEANVGSSPEPETGSQKPETVPSPRHPVFVALRETIRACAIPKKPFADLLQAFRQDQTVHRYESFNDILGYCRYSADPVGRIVLYLCGYRDEERQRLSDYTCTALQLANFWQDVTVDNDKGRIYLPLESLRQFGVTEDQIAQRRFTSRFRDLMRFEVDRARDLFRRGLPLAERVDRELAIDIELFSRGGLAILDAIERQDYDVLRSRPSISKMRKFSLVAGAAVRRLFA